MSRDYDEHVRRECRGAWLGLLIMLASFSISATVIALLTVTIRSFFAG